MILRCIGHAKFLLCLDNGFRIVTDPYDASTGYPVAPLRADAVIVSHGHHDHSAVDTVEGWTAVVREAGDHTLAPDVTVHSFGSFHDDARGSKRGENLVSVVEAEGLRVAHLGDLGHLPDEALCRALGRIDLLMIPVGGHFTIDAAQAVETCRLLQPRVVVPMHYRTRYNAGWPIARVEDFLSLMQEEAERLDLLRVTAGDLACQPHLVVLNPDPRFTR